MSAIRALLEVFAVFWDIVKSVRRSFYFFFVLIVVYQVVSIVDTYVLTYSIEFVGKHNDWQSIAVLVLAVYLFDEFFNRYDNYVDWIIIIKILNPIYVYVKKMTLDRFLSMDLSWHHRQRSGDLLTRVQHGIDKLDSMANDISWELAPTLVQFVLSLAPLLWFSPISAGILVLSLPLFLLLSVKKHRAQKELRKVRHDHYAETGAIAMEAVNHISTVQLYSLQERFMGMLKNSLQIITDALTKEVHLGIYRYGRWQNRITTWAKRAVMFLLILQVQRGEITLAQVIFLWAIVEKLVHSFWRFGRLYDHAADSSEAISRLAKIRDLNSGISVGSRNALPEDKTLELNGVSFAYNGGGDALTNVTFGFQAGKSYALIGPSGAGKSTLVKLLMRLIEPTQGVVTLGGIDVKEFGLESLRSLFAVVEQEPPVINDTIAANIALGSRNASFTQIVAAAKAADLHGTIEAMPEGYDTNVGERGVHLSGGQKQRLAIARAFLRDAPFLVLDEPTSALDSVTEKRIQETLNAFLTDSAKTVIIIAHRLSTIRHVDEIIVLDNGRVVEQGSHKELLARGGLYATMWYEQVGD